VSRPLVAVLGTRYTDFAIEGEVLDPLGVRLCAAAGSSAEEIIEVAGSAEVILAGSAPRFDAGVLERLSCKGIVRYGVGTESIDLVAARRLGLVVGRVSDYGTEAVALHSVTLALALLRRIPEADRSLRAGSWSFADLRPLHLPARLTAGVLGFGRIGRQSAEYLHALGFEICAYDEFVEVPADSPVVPVSFDELLERSDILMLHAPGRPDGTAVLGAEQLSKMRQGSILVNTARGSLIDVPALVEGLRHGRPARAGLDVFPQEPIEFEAFAGVEDAVLLTPHMAWYTEESEEDMRRKAANEAARILQGVPLRDPVVESR
jgi:D-3-phosphoglycerate dehydrogenase / 2-oxoglutarate reductase